MSKRTKPKLHPHAFDLPTKADLDADGVVVTNDGVSRRVVIPMPKLWARLGRRTGSRDVEHLTTHILQLYGISVDNDYDKQAEPGFSSFTQALALGVNETHEAAAQEAPEDFIKKVLSNLSDNDYFRLVADRVEEADIDGLCEFLALVKLNGLAVMLGKE